MNIISQKTLDRDKAVLYSKLDNLQKDIAEFLGVVRNRDRMSSLEICHHITLIRKLFNNMETLIDHDSQTQVGFVANTNYNDTHESLVLSLMSEYDKDPTYRIPPEALVQLFKMETIIDEAKNG